MGLEPPEAAAGISATDLASRIAVIETRTDLSTTERELVLEQLRAAASRLEAAEVARRSTAEYAAALQSAPETIASLSAQSALPPQREPLPEDADPVDVQLRLAALQTESVSLHGTQRKLADQLRGMESRPADARAELGQLRAQLDRAQTTVPATASPLLAEASRLREQAAREELAARIEKIEQELSSLPTRKSIATAQHDLVGRRANEVDAAIEGLAALVVSRRKQQVEEEAARARELERSLAGQPAEIRELARDSVALRTEAAQLVQRLDRERNEQRRSRNLLDDAVEARNNADQILAIGAISDEAARLLRSLQKSLVSGEQIKRRIAERNRALVDLRVSHFKTQQVLRELPPTVAAEGEQGTTASITAQQHLAEQLLEHRRAGLADMADIQQQLIGALLENNALDAELLTASAQLHGVLDKRLLWLPSTAPLGDGWLQQLGVGVGWLLAPANWSALPRAMLTSLRAHPIRLLLMLISVAGLFGIRGRLQAALPRLAKSVGHREDNFGTTLLAWAATFLLALAWPFALATVGWFLGWSGGGFANFLGQGLLSLALLWLMLGLFIDMCRPEGLFIAHFHWGPRGTRRMARALRMLLLMVAPTAVLTGMTDASGDPDLIDGVGRLGFMVGSLASAWFLYRVLRPVDGAPTTARAPGVWIRRVPAGWARVLVAVPIFFALLAAVGYYTSAREVQSRLFTSGWIILAVVIVYYIAIRGVMVASRRAAYLQADSLHARALAEAPAATGSEDGSEVLALQNQQPEIDSVTVNQQTRALLRAAFGVALAVLILGLWREMIPALNVFNDVVLWSRTVEGIGESVVAVTLSDVLMSLVIVGLTAIAARNVPGFLEIMLLPRARVDSGTRYAIAAIARYVITGIGLVIALQRIGVDWSRLQWVVAALGVGLGFGLQEIVANFVSGLIILFERPVRVGDVVTIGDTTGTVSRIKMRSITITNFDNFEVLVPNKAFITDTVQNWTLTTPITRVVLKVGIGYGSDVRKARAVMEGVVASDPRVLRSPAPDVMFTRLGDSALEFEVRFHVAQIEDRRAVTDTFFAALATALAEAGIEIPFPQRDVHVRHVGRDDAALSGAAPATPPER
ncbi:mechanosensitive ion channel domain-containing protein [Novilysobacter antarcticus]|uniref:mechanosensitive ion channel domain-containing protein n=1 Tax=Novilysobacter antarcticus TaxID=2862543 RepID=UPI001C99A619|nr:mechanosensitive ion channel domain-containing protein [Lysobacter antarcticus]